MADPKRRFVNVEVAEVSLVKAGDNHGARAVLWKARKDPTPGERLEILLPFAKAMFDEIQDDRRMSGAMDVLAGRLWALESAIWDALFLEDSRGREAELVQASVEQFGDSIDQDVSGILAGNILKSFGEWNEAGSWPARIDFAKHLGGAVSAALEEFTSSAGGSPGDKTKESIMAKKIAVAIDTGGLSDDQRATLEKVLGEQGMELATPENESELKKLADENAQLRGTVADLQKAASQEDTRTDLEKALDTLPAPVRQMIEKREQEAQEDRKLVSTLRKEADRKEFAKSVDFETLPRTQEEWVADLVDLPTEVRDKVVKALEIADEALGRSGITESIGSDHGSETGGSAEAQVDSMAQELRKSRPDLSIEQARTEIYKTNPQLWEEVENEGAAN